MEESGPKKCKMQETISDEHSYANINKYQSPRKVHKCYFSAESNILWKLKQVELMNRTIEKLKQVGPSSVCCICAKILYPSNEKWIQGIPENEHHV